MFSSVSPYGRKRSTAPCIHRRCRGGYPRQREDGPYRQRFELNTIRQRRYSRLHNWPRNQRQDRKSTRLNSSHSQISYAVFCLKKKKKKNKKVTKKLNTN